jgi:hypothetical protein
MEDILSRIIIITALLLAISLTDSDAGQAEAELYAYCGQVYNDCQTQCVHIELTAPTPFTTTGVPACNPKNNRIAQCRNLCYVDHIRCRGGK